MHLFEFMDQAWLPSSLRATLRDILECGNSRPFRSYYDWAVTEIIRVAGKENCHTVVELGAGTAPITRHLLRRQEADDLELIVCDANPDTSAYREIAAESKGRVRLIDSPVDFSRPRRWPSGALLVLSATLHHIPAAERSNALNAMRLNGNRILIFEPLGRNLLSILFVGLSLFPAIATPLRYLTRPGRMRRFVWCWALPVAPVMFWWDGIVSCLRQWTPIDWAVNMKAAATTRMSTNWTIHAHVFSQLVEISGDGKPYVEISHLDESDREKTLVEVSPIP